MNIYSISDLHLSFATSPDPGNWDAVEYKPMSDLDDRWTDHAREIYNNWLQTVDENDVVLVPGDISWAMRLDQLHCDLQYLAMLTGHIVAVQGNHDYWWQSISRTREAMPPNMQLIQNDHMRFGELAVCGSRGWLCPNGSFFKEEDRKIYNRELIRMENSLKSAVGAKEIIAMTHYMPTNEKHEYSGFIELFQKYGVKAVVYGHLHARACRYRLPETLWGINFYLVSADYLEFKPQLICRR